MRHFFASSSAEHLPREKAPIVRDRIPAGESPERSTGQPAPRQAARYSPTTAGGWISSRQLSAIVSTVAYRRSISANDLPDLLQEVCMALWKAGVDQPINATWVFHTSMNKAAEVHRRARLSNPSDPIDQSLNAISDPELLLLLHARAATLPMRLREFYRLYYNLGLSERAVAHRLETSRAAVRWLKHRCRNLLSQPAVDRSRKDRLSQP
jgi:RNA polymerase sigma factor (sigma-70 family)